MKAAKKSGNTVYLLTNKTLEHEPWPRESIDKFFYLEDVENNFETYKTLIEGTAYLFRSNKIDQIIALDDFDVEKAALLREHFRVPGMGQTTARYFRDKLAMRVQARDNGILVPEFSSLFNDQEINDFLDNVPGPWFVKPRSEASATGIKKVNNKEEAWNHINSLGDDRHNFLIEAFKGGDVYHVDALSYDYKVIFEKSSKYLDTPFEVAHGGGIFRTVMEKKGSEDSKNLSVENKKVMKAFGLKFSASHTEFIKSHEDGKFYFLETASRVGGAHIAEMVEFASGINLWREWANIESAVGSGKTYKLPKTSNEYGGVLITLSNQKHPDMSPFNDKEVVWKMEQDYHIGLIVKAKSQERILELMDKYAQMIMDLGYHASAPAPKKTIH